ncbi:MAG: hypothetical protein WC459_01250 [Patescibacteria group bacterium]
MMAENRDCDEGYKRFLHGMEASRKDLLASPEAVKKQIVVFDKWIEDSYDKFRDKLYFQRMAGDFVRSRNYLVRHLKDHFGMEEPIITLDDFWKKLAPRETH